MILLGMISKKGLQLRVQDSCPSYYSWERCNGDSEGKDPRSAHHLAIGWTQLQVPRVSSPSALGNPAWWKPKTLKIWCLVIVNRPCHFLNPNGSHARLHLQFEKITSALLSLPRESLELASGKVELLAWSLAMSGFVSSSHLGATSGELDTIAIRLPPFANAHKQTTRTSTSQAFATPRSCIEASH